MAVPPSRRSWLRAGTSPASSPGPARSGAGAASCRPAVKAAADDLGLPVVHRVDEALLDFDADLGVVVAYGARAPPRPRAPGDGESALLAPTPVAGAAPVERALLAGDRETGVCLMQLEEGLDTGRCSPAVSCPSALGRRRPSSGPSWSNGDGPAARDAPPRTARSRAPAGRADVRPQARPGRAPPRLEQPPASSTGSCGWAAPGPRCADGD